MTGGTLRVTPALLAFALGAVVGAGSSAVVSNTTGPVPNLVAGDVVAVEYDPSATPSIAVSVNVYNASDHDVTALPTSIAGWLAVGDETGTQALPARSWTELAFTALPDCDRVITNVAVVDVDATLHQILIGPQVAERLSYVRQNYCGLDRHLYVEPELLAGSVEGDALRIDLRLPGHGRPMLEDQLITNAFTRTPGWDAEADGLPATYLPGEPVQLSVRWRIQECRFAMENALAPSIMFTTEDNVVIESWLGDRGVAMLARHVATQCVD